MEIVLKQEIVERIKSDTVLFGKIAEKLGVRLVSLPQILYANPERLTQAGVLRIIREHLNIRKIVSY